MDNTSSLRRTMLHYCRFCDWSALDSQILARAPCLSASLCGTHVSHISYISLLVRPGWLSVPVLAVALLSLAAQSLFFCVVLCAQVLPRAWATLPPCPPLQPASCVFLSSVCFGVLEMMQLQLSDVMQSSCNWWWPMLSILYVLASEDNPS